MTSEQEWNELKRLEQEAWSTMDNPPKPAGIPNSFFGQKMVATCAAVVFLAGVFAIVCALIWVGAFFLRNI